MTDKILLVLCVHREEDLLSERFVYVVMNLGGRVQRSQPLVEQDLRNELIKFGFADGAIDGYVQKARAFRTIATSSLGPGTLGGS